jgi:hypothetical protein
VTRRTSKPEPRPEQVKLGGDPLPPKHYRPQRRETIPVKRARSAADYYPALTPDDDVRRMRQVDARWVDDLSWEE